MIMQVAEWNRANDELIQAKQRSNVEIEVLLKKETKKMKRVIYLLIFVLLAYETVLAQSKEYNEIISEIKAGGNKLGMTTVGREALRLASYLPFSMTDDIKTLLNGVTVLKVVRNKSGSTANFFDNSVKAFDDAKYREVDVSKYADRNTVRLFCKRKWLSIREVHAVTTKERGMNISVFGKFKIRTIRRVLKNNELP
jgi:hypothetical protein